jgi:hypothetical protein
MLCGAESITKLYKTEKICDHVHRLIAKKKKMEEGKILRW